jgi:hypothetical protein
LIYIKTTDVSLLRIASGRLPPDERQRSLAQTLTQRRNVDLGGRREILAV